MESKDFISLYSINSLIFVDPVQTQEECILMKNVLSESLNLWSPFYLKKNPRNHRNSLKSHVSCYLEMQRSGHFNIFYHTFISTNKWWRTSSIWFFFPLRRKHLKRQRSVWKKVRDGYISDANTVRLGSSLWPWCQSAHCHCPWHQEHQLHL